jgi:hypothetical protein
MIEIRQPTTEQMRTRREWRRESSLVEEEAKRVIRTIENRKNKEERDRERGG